MVCAEISFSVMSTHLPAHTQADTPRQTETDKDTHRQRNLEESEGMRGGSLSSETAQDAGFVKGTLPSRLPDMPRPSHNERLTQL